MARKSKDKNQLSLFETKPEPKVSTPSKSYHALNAESLFLICYKGGIQRAHVSTATYDVQSSTEHWEKAGYEVEVTKHKQYWTGFHDSVYQLGQPKP